MDSMATVTLTYGQSLERQAIAHPQSTSGPRHPMASSMFERVSENSLIITPCKHPHTHPFPHFIPCFSFQNNLVNCFEKHKPTPPPPLCCNSHLSGSSPPPQPHHPPLLRGLRHSPHNPPNRAHPHHPQPLPSATWAASGSCVTTKQTPPTPTTSQTRPLPSQRRSRTAVAPLVSPAPQTPTRATCASRQRCVHS